MPATYSAPAALSTAELEEKLRHKPWSTTSIKMSMRTRLVLQCRQEAESLNLTLQDFIRLLLASYFLHPDTHRALAQDRPVLLDFQLCLQQQRAKVVRDHTRLIKGLRTTPRYPPL